MATAHGQQQTSLPSAPQLQTPPAAAAESPSSELFCDTWLEKSRQAIKAEDFSVAIDAAQSAARACPDHSRALFYVADAQMLSKQFAAAIDTLHASLAISPQDEPALELLGEVQYLDDHDAEAETAFRKAIAAAPENPEPRYMLGRLYYEGSRYQEAAAQLQSAIQIDPKLYKAYDSLALCQEALGDNDAALKSYLKALELVYKDHPEYDTVYADLAEFMLKQGDRQRAFNLAAEAARRNPRNPRNFYLAGKVLMDGDHADASLRWLKRAAQIDPAYPEPHYLMARIYKMQGRDADATAEVRLFKTLEDRAPKIKR